MTDRAAYMSSRLVFPVSSPWALRWRGDPTAWLSARQRALLLYLARTQKTGGRRTLEAMGSVLGVTSRGQVSREMRRLRQLELIGYRTRRGSRGWHAIYLKRAASKLRAVRRALKRANDSPSTPHGGFISRIGLERAWRKTGHPPGAGLASARDGPRRGHGPPRTLNARCPLNHPTRLGRRSWRTVLGGGLEAVFHGVCRRCDGREILEVVSVPAPAPPLREPSPAELADPALLEARLRQAAALEAEGLQPRLVRTYRDMAQRSTDGPRPVNGVVHQSPDSLAAIVHKIRPE